MSEAMAQWITWYPECLTLVPACFIGLTTIACSLDLFLAIISLIPCGEEKKVKQEGRCNRAFGKKALAIDQELNGFGRGVSLDEYYLDSPTGEELGAYRKQQKKAAKQPLYPGIELKWEGPNLHPECLPPQDYPHHNSDVVHLNPSRPLLPHLISQDSPSGGGAGWSLRLVEPLQTGVDKRSQVWKCSVTRFGEECGGSNVVLKLRQQSLFPEPWYHPSLPEFGTFNWLPAKHMIQRESQVYQ
ncbi:hypothetical protein T439DRAFT_335245 [Meredithblackwellia eburnea MCA 4105]